MGRRRHTSPDLRVPISGDAAASSSDGELAEDSVAEASLIERSRKRSFSMGTRLKERRGSDPKIAPQRSKSSRQHGDVDRSRKQSWSGVLEGPASVASKVLHRNDDSGNLTPRALKTHMEEKLDRVKLLQAHSSQHDAAVFTRDWLFALNTLLSLVATCVFFELNWKPTPDWEAPPPRWAAALGAASTDEPPGEVVESDSVTALKWCISGLTLLLIVQVFEYQHFQYLIHHAVESAAAGSKSPSWWHHSWPPRARQAASEGLGLAF